MNPSADPIGLFNAGRLDEAVALATETASDSVVVPVPAPVTVMDAVSWPAWL